ncbi:hypothetical protein ACIRED_31795, partial [Streptomyces roseolilacinus]
VLLAVVAQVRVGVAWGASPGGLDGLPPLVGEPGAAVGAHRAAGLSLGLVLCGDRGSQFRSRKFGQALDRHRVAGSVGRVGAAGENAAMESFFSLLQKNVLDRRKWATREELRIAIVTWIERICHRRRRQAVLGRLAPVESETVMTTPALQAA